MKHQDDTIVTPERKAPDVAHEGEQSATFERLRALLIEMLGVDAIRVEPHARFMEDLGTDSLDCVELQLAIEDAFGVEIADDEMDDFVTVGDLVKRIDAAVPPGEED